MATVTIMVPGRGFVVDAEDGNTIMIPGRGFVAFRAAPAPAGGRILHMVGPGGLVGPGGMAGAHGGLVG